MAVTIDPVMTTRVPVLLSIWSARVAEARWMTIVVRAADATRAIKLATAAAREYKEPDEDLTVTVELLDPRGPEGVVLVDAN